MKIKKENTALIIVDRQEDFAEEQFHKSDVETIMNSYHQLLGDRQMDVYNFSSGAFGKTLPELNKYLKSVENVSYMKKKPTMDSCFTNRNLLESLVERGTDNLIVTGISGHIVLNQLHKWVR
ncbi:MAG: isochorismatase family protein [Nanoarchaeota archaeon]|jgi:nicotinamidase-related amidase|nr:isochorismatase family protein [Nanoarchaeota archaeon]